MTTYDPDTDVPPVYDDRPEFIVKVKDPARQKIGRNNRKRGHKAEREWFRHIEVAVNRAGRPVKERPELRGSVAKEDVRWIDDSFEVKTIQQRDAIERWLTPGALTKAWADARRHCDHRRPLVVVCLRRQGVLSKWRVYEEEDGEWFEGHSWIASRVIDLMRASA